ncbi:MAG: hypothetical protein JWN33_636 [Candidatus Saccharibacteria bacterium]|nr:hypothetical protein [Candidatus Saccharibacteria bacterium]
MSIIDKVKQLNLPLDEMVVIGSGLLDAYGLREANDLDIVVPEYTYRDLRLSGEYRVGMKHDEGYLYKDDIEVWRSWGTKAGKPNFKALKADGVVIDGVTFVNPAFLIQMKQERGSDKDKADIEMLEGYLNAN